MPIFRGNYPPPPPPLTINKFRGLNLSTTSTQIDLAESPDSLNIVLDEMARPDKRTGYKKLFATSLGAGQINGMYQFKKTDGTTIYLIHHGTHLYTQIGSDQPVSIYASIANAKSRFFTFNNKCYILDGTNYLVYDGSTVVDVSTVATLPTLTISTPPAGGGTPFEDLNLLTSGFKRSYSADGTATVFKLGITNLDATAVTAVVNGVNKVETTDFTVNRTTGDVTFLAVPAVGANNVIITAYKTQAGFAGRIKKCRFFVIYGGTNDTRVFLAGNPEFPNSMWRSGVFDPAYFGENKFQKVGSDAGGITGFAKQYSSCLIFKEPTPNDIVIWNMNYQIGSDGLTVTFPVAPMNDEVGCSATDSIQLIENTPAFLNKEKGVYLVAGTNVKDERNVQHFSNKIDRSGDVEIRALLNEANLQNAISVDYDKKYILCVNNYCYVFDYRQGEWVIWSNIPASCFLERDGILYFGSNAAGMVYKFMKQGEVGAYNDDGATINAYWKSKVMSFDADEFLKTVQKVFFSLKPGRSTSADLYYVTDKTVSELITSSRMNLFDFRTLNFSKFSFIMSSLPQEVAAKIKAKKIIYFQLILKNDKLDESMGILSVGIKFNTVREVK